MPDPCAAHAEAPVDFAKQEYFDRYWITRDFLCTDRRTMERAQIVWSLLARRRGRALDVGCGRGLVAAFLLEQGFDVEAVDISPQAVDLTSQRGVNAYLLDLEQRNPLGVYDLITCLEVLQQVRDPLAVLGRLVRALAADGEIVVSLPNEFHLLRRIRIAAGKADFGGLDDSHLKLFSPGRARELLAQAGLRIRHTAHTGLVPPSYVPLAQLARAAAGLWPAGLALSAIHFAHRSGP